MFPHPSDLPAPLQPSQPNPQHLAELDRLGDQIAELSAHIVLRGRLTPEVGALPLRALDAAREALYQRRRATEAAQAATDPATEAPTRPQQQAEALALLAGRPCCGGASSRPPPCGISAT